MGWYSDLKESDWFAAATDVGKGLGDVYEQTKIQNAPMQQASVLTQTENPHQVNAQTWEAQKDTDASKSPDQTGGFNTQYLVWGGAALAGVAALAILAKALK